WIGKVVDFSKVEEMIEQELESSMAQIMGVLQKELSAQIGAQITELMTKTLLPTIQNAIATQMSQILSEQLAPLIAQQMGSIISQQIMPLIIGSVSNTMSTALSTIIGSTMNQIMGQITSQLTSALSSAFDFDASSLTDAFDIEVDPAQMRELMMASFAFENNTFESNLRKFDYADMAKPTSISIYPKDFDSKEEIIKILDAYNERMEEQGYDDRVISYTDFVGTLMKSVTSIINTISYVLIAFVAISLVVSSIMIGIITYISVLERKKEIGILRSIGASKGDIGRVFNAETLIVGLSAGLIGVGLTALATIPINYFIGERMLNISNITILPIEAAGVLVLISMVLSFIAGLIPSSAASRRDPVEALRSE
ncbi:MAG: FtsX-like permease family protein, partial [Actinomycetia bacterium]|nr:FtsX-like permease family protein [Actinomycetes bacterium]